MPLVAAVLSIAVCVVVALGLGAAGSWTVGDQLGLVALGALLAAFLGRYAMIRAVPTATGLVIRNLLLTRTVGWDEIVAVRFPDGDPWVSVELDDTDVVAVMAIQRVDAEFGRAEARRLTALAASRRGGPASPG